MKTARRGRTTGTPERGGHLPEILRLMGPKLYEYRWRFVLILALLPVSALSAMLVPYLTKVAIDDYVLPAVEAGSFTAYWDPLVLLAQIAMVVVVAGYVADAFYVQVLQRTGQRLLAALREVVYRRSLRLPRTYYDRNPIGSILTRVTSDIEALAEGLAGNVLSLIADLLKTFAYLAMMFYLNWRLTLVLLIAVPALTLLIRFFQRRVRVSFFRARQALSDATGYLQECLSGIKTIQLFAAEAKAHARFEAKNRRFFEAQNRSNLYDALLFSLVEGLTTLTLAAVLWFAAGELLAGVLTLGVLVAFMEYIQRLFVPVRELSQQLAILQRGMAALDHIGALCGAALDPAETTAEEHDEPAGRFERLEFDDVRFRYGPGGPEVLKGLSFRIGKGQTLAIVGATGSGKSSITRLLTRAYGGYEGSIRINGRELTDYSADSLGRMISMVHQGVFLFNGTIAFNIGLGRPGVDAPRIDRAAHYVHAHEFIERLDGGAGFNVLQGGTNLSAGQSQLVSFARAVAAETELIVLDEATSSVDSITEALIERAVGRLYEDKTVIAIAHRLSTIRNADVILVLDGGRIVETGNHAELMAMGGTYAALVGDLEREQVEPESKPESKPGPDLRRAKKPEARPG